VVGLEMGFKKIKPPCLSINMWHYHEREKMMLCTNSFDVHAADPYSKHEIKHINMLCLA
jgi:hypothetical protein